MNDAHVIARHITGILQQLPDPVLDAVKAELSATDETGAHDAVMAARIDELVESAIEALDGSAVAELAARLVGEWLESCDESVRGGDFNRWFAKLSAHLYGTGLIP